MTDLHRKHRLDSPSRASCMLVFAISALAVTLLAHAVDESWLPRSVPDAEAMESRDALPVTTFYDPPSPLAQAVPGALIRFQKFDGYSLPPGASAVRILYYTRKANGVDTVASGAVLIPAGQPPAEGWPVIAWAHGTSGVARQCAPSLMKDLEYGDEGLMPMVSAGSAVVAPDYAGLGTPGPHQYEQKLAQANDTVYAISAAQHAVPSLGKRWVAIGHSQGGTAVLGVAELEATTHDAGYRGAIDVAGDIEFAHDPGNDPTIVDPDTAMYWIYDAYAVHASYPAFDVRRMLTPVGMRVYGELTTRGCWDYGYAAMKALGPKRVGRLHWTEHKEVQQWFQDNDSSRKPIRGPLVILAGDDDQTVPFAGMTRGVVAMCRHGLPIIFWHRRHLDHDPLMQQTTPAMLAWSRGRIRGLPWRSNCGSVLRNFGSTVSPRHYPPGRLPWGLLVPLAFPSS